MRPNRVIVVSNRLPVVLAKKDNRWTMEPGSGGLVSALEPLLRASSGIWLGWTGTEEDFLLRTLVRSASQERGITLEPVFLTEHERVNFYSGFANQIVWPLFHDLQSRCNFDPAFWDAYLTANQSFCNAILDIALHDDLIWVHDYQLISVASFLRNSGVRNQLAYFHHIPFPAPDIFEKLPWRQQILTSLLDYDIVGFQTPRDRRNFLTCLRRFVPEAAFELLGDRVWVREPGRNTVIGTFPISVDFYGFEAQAKSPEVEERTAAIRHDLGQCQMVLGVDRMDYTKGIPERLDAFADLLSRHRDMHHKVTLVQLVVPSREDIPKYAELKDTVQRKVSEINGRFAQPGWVPVQYIHRAIDRAELCSLYRAADVALVTPLKDGMNLVAKEYCASRVDNDGVLILSEFAGAAVTMGKSAFLVNPYDTRDSSDTLLHALRMPPAERRRRMLRLRAGIRKHNVFRWRDSVMSCIDDPVAIAASA